MSEIAVIRRIQGTRSYFVTIAQKMLPATVENKYTITVVNPKKYWLEESREAYGHLVKTVGRSRIYNSIKIVINKELAQALDLAPDSEKLVWVRVLPFTENPPPPPLQPYVARTTKIHFDGSSLFFVVSKRQIDLLSVFTPPKYKGSNLYISVVMPGRAIDYIKKPTLVKQRNYYKVVLPSELFRDRVKPGDTVIVKISVTNRPEEFYYV